MTEGPAQAGGRSPFEYTGLLYACDVVCCESLSGGVSDARDAIRRLVDALEYLAIDPEGARWALIAAVAGRMDATVVTRNPADFEPYGVPVPLCGGPPQASAGTKRGSTS